MIASALFAAAAYAGDLSYEDALSLAQDKNPQLRGAAAQVSVAEGGVLAARGVWDPTLGAGASQSFGLEKGRFQGVGYTSDSTVYGWNAGLSQTLPTGTTWSADWANQRLDVNSTFAGIEQRSLDFDARLNASVSQQLLRGHKMAYNLERVRSAEASLSSAEASLLQERQTVLSSVATSYWDLVYATEAAKVASEAVEVSAEERRIVQALVTAGNLAPVEATRAEAAHAQAQLALIDAENTRFAASDGLAVQLGLPVGQLIVPSSLPGDVPMGLNISTEAAVKAALDGNPGLVILQTNLDNAELLYTNAQHGMLPTLSVTAAAGLQGRTSDQDESGVASYGGALSEMISADYRNRYVGADFSMPLGRRVERGTMNSRAGSVTRAELDLEAQQLFVSQQVATQVRSLESARQRMELAALNLRLAEETLAAEKAKQAAGRAIEKDVIEAQRQRDAAEVEAVRSRTDYRKALVALEALQGKL